MKTLAAISQFFNKTFALWVLVAAVLAYISPDFYKPLAGWISPLLGLVMFGMGLTLSVNDFKLVFSHPVDVLIGINLLREGLDLPEVSLIAILDADKEGFLRSETSLIQTIGRAARNAEGRVLLYADKITPAMRAAMDETARRRQIQDDYNKAHGIIPQTIRKDVREIIEISKKDEESARRRGKRKLSERERDEEIRKLEKQMQEASKMLEFEYAAILRDRIIELRKESET